ncbi:beta family protein [Streptomyces sp. NBC_00102]|uniref:beta family protein n=1 Tax=Streptomyces sp. NBC_00102 TaxID=2975652 RepID=UPI00224E77EC|nr:beta family protein [Streptomyces sp. NBC_00102]MCX5400363.1 beta family protein [Streptomyces sp. NBC_00102]
MPKLRYVPVLPIRRHAAEAFRDLRPEIRDEVTPLWSLPPHPGTRGPRLAAAVRAEIAAVSRVRARGLAWLDAPLADREQIPVLADVFAQYIEFGGFCPVTGPLRPTGQQAAARTLAVDCGRALGVRVEVPGEWNPELTEAVARLLERIGDGVKIELLIDLGGVLADRPGIPKDALRALDALVPLADWRSVVIIGGGFPRVTAEMLVRGVREEPRRDWRLWHEIRRNLAGRLPALGFGDYGVQPAVALARPDQGGGPDWGYLRYTTDRSYALVRTAHSGPDRAKTNREAARELLRLPDFRGALASSGETWLRDCARALTHPAVSAGSDGPGTGNPATWLRVGNVQHMTHVVRSLAGL